LVSWSFCIGFFVLAQGSEIALNLQLRAWAASYASSAVERLQQVFLGLPASDADDRTLGYFGLYALLSVTTLLFFTLRSFYILWRGLTAAKSIYDSLISSIVSARTRFFDTVPGTFRSLPRMWS
jgi:hypothetical protein